MKVCSCLLAGTEHCQKCMNGSSSDRFIYNLPWNPYIEEEAKVIKDLQKKERERS